MNALPLAGSFDLLFEELERGLCVNERFGHGLSSQLRLAVDSAKSIPTKICPSLRTIAHFVGIALTLRVTLNRRHVRFFGEL